MFLKNFGVVARQNILAHYFDTRLPGIVNATTDISEDIIKEISYMPQVGLFTHVNNSFIFK